MSSTLVDATAPTLTFAELGLSDQLVKVLTKQGITHPLPIQAATIADALAGHDVAGKAPTGSGKTLAFSLPLAARVSKGSPRRPKGLVLAPTRELAAQIAVQLAPLLNVRGLRSHPIYGGVGFGPQKNALRRGVDVLVACPGRLEDLIEQGDVVLSDVQMVVVDEADRMADMGFLPAVRRILDATNDRRQTLLFSATLDGDVDVLVRRYQHDPVRHDVASVSEASQARHRFEFVEHAARVELCASLVAGEASSIVFVRTKHGADRLARQLGHSGVAAQSIHGGRSQSQRERTLAAFRAGRVRVLVATDVAARGIHVDDVACVIHFDLPADPKDYVHRSGRTARAGAAGTVIAFVTPDQRGAASALSRALEIEIEGAVAEAPRNRSDQGDGGARRHPRPRAGTPGGAPASVRSGPNRRRKPGRSRGPQSSGR